MLIWDSSIVVAFRGVVVLLLLKTSADVCDGVVLRNHLSVWSCTVLFPFWIENLPCPFGATPCGVVLRQRNKEIKACQTAADVETGGGGEEETVRETREYMDHTHPYPTLF